MSLYFNEINDRLTSLVRNTKSPRSVARAYKQYLADKTYISSKMLTAIAEASLGITNRTSSAHTVIDILDNVDLSYDTPVFTSEGSIAKIGDMITVIVEEGIDSFPVTTDHYGNSFDINSTVDNLVESFQSSKVIESAFSVLEETQDGVIAGFADISARVNSLGMELTTSGMNTLTMVGDIMNDSVGGVVDKISTIGELITSGMDRMIDNESDSIIIIPKFGDGEYNAVPPVSAMLQGIDIDFSKPISLAVSAVKLQVRLAKSFFTLAKKVVNIGWNTASKYISDTFVDPVDFQVVNKDSKSHIVDIPIIDQMVRFDDMFNASGARHQIYLALREMRIGTMKSAYTPFGVVNIVKVSADHIRVLVHVIPSQPLKSRMTDDADFEYSIQAIYTFSDSGQPEGITGYYSDGIDSSLTGIFDRYVSSDAQDVFLHEGDDDGYYLSAIAASMLRLKTISGMSNLLVNRDILSPSMLNKTPSTCYVDGDEIGLSTRWPSVIGMPLFDNYNNLIEVDWLNMNERPKFMNALKNRYRGNQVTNKDFYNMMKQSYFIGPDAMEPLVSMVFLNDVNVMLAYSLDEPGVPAFLPSVYENSYQVPMYGISTDGKNGEKVEKFFKGLFIVASAVVGGIIIGKSVIKIRNSIRMQGLTLSGLQRFVENMDPSDPEYKIKYDEYNKARKMFNRKNRFLSFLGMGVSKTATSSSFGMDSFEGFIPNNDEIIRKIDEVSSYIK